jgi:hypothetical protein
MLGLFVAFMKRSKSGLNAYPTPFPPNGCPGNPSDRRACAHAPAKAGGQNCGTGRQSGFTLTKPRGAESGKAAPLYLSMKREAVAQSDT